MNKKQKSYRVSISFPSEMAKIIWAYAEEDERPFTWEVIRMLKDLFEERKKDSFSTYTSSSSRDARYKHQRIVKQVQESKMESAVTDSIERKTNGKP
ncbi:MAG TPA: hypothetical protein VF974_00800 [Patescibacteria group bacterium]